MAKPSGIKVFAPATVANIACGYDVMGFAIDKPGDEIILRPSSKPGIQITKITGDKGRLPKDPVKNTAGYAALQMLKALGDNHSGFEMEIHKKMPFGSGLGSSAASAVAAVMAMNEILRRPFTKRELLPFAVDGESKADGAYHADNVAPSLLGGIIFIRDNQTLDVHRLPTPSGLYAAVVHPKIEILTKDARDILSDSVSLNNSIAQNGNLGGFICSIFRSDFDLMKRSLQDVIIEPQRAQLIPHFYDVKEAALNEGALGCSISGAGPSIFALYKNSLEAENGGQKMAAVFNDNKIDCELFLSPINNEGTILL